MAAMVLYFYFTNDISGACQKHPVKSYLQGKWPSFGCIESNQTLRQC